VPAGGKGAAGELLMCRKTMGGDSFGLKVGNKICDGKNHCRILNEPINFQLKHGIASASTLGAGEKSDKNTT
jgi:hypothetical protein